MDQFVFVPASVYNKSVTTQSVAKQELPQYKAEQTPTYHIDSLNRDFNKKLFGKAEALIDKILSCSRIKFSNSETIILDSVETGVLFSDFTQHLRRKNADVPDIYFTLPDAAGTSPSRIFNQNAKVNDRGSWGPFKVWTSEANKTVYARCCCLRVLYATWQKLADYQFQRSDSFYIQRLLIQNLLLQQQNSREWGLLLDSGMKFGAWLLLTLVNWQKRLTV